jgi:hypothetical protein
MDLIRWLQLSKLMDIAFGALSHSLAASGSTSMIPLAIASN